MTNVLVLSPEPVRARMAGMGIRATRIAGELGRFGHDVLLGSPGPEDGYDPGVGSIDSSRSGFEIESFDVVIASGHAGQKLALDRFSGALVADLYDPFLVENLSYARTLGPEVFENDRRALFGLVDRADFVLAASNEQRLFYLGLLLGRGRLTPADLADDPDGRHVCDVVPFGVDDLPPGPAEPPEQIGPGPSDVFFGGVYDWYDPGLVLDAWPAVLSAVPKARLLFCENPNPESTPQRRLVEVKSRAERECWLGKSVHVLPWIEREKLGSLFRSCRVGVLAHGASLETDLSFRTRVLDFLWAGLPVVSVEGGSAARLVERDGAGLVVPPKADALARALVTLLTNEEARRRCSVMAATAAKAFRWSTVLAPLVRYVNSPRRAPTRDSLKRRLFGRLSGITPT